MKVQLGIVEKELKGITIRQYEKVQEYKNKGERIGDVEFISLLTDFNERDIRDSTIQQISFVSKVLNTYYQKQTEQTPLKRLIKYKGDTLGLTQPSTMTWGEWSDLEILTSKKPLDLRLISSIMYRPCESYSLEDLSSQIVKYDYEECVRRSKDMDDFMISDVLNSLFFFIQYGKKLIEIQNKYMEIQKTKESDHLMTEPPKKS